MIKEDNFTINLLKWKNGKTITIFWYAPHIFKASLWSLKRFIKKLKAKVYKKMTVNDRETYLSYLKKLVDQY